MTGNYACSAADKIASYADDLDHIGTMSEEWLRDLDMTYRLHSALKDVWKVVEMELLGKSSGDAFPLLLFLSYP